MKKSELQNMISNAVNKAAEDYLRNLDSAVKRLIESSVLSLLGLSNSWGGKTEIDHCNGRSSILTNVIEERARKQVEEIVSNFKINADNKEVKDAFEKEFKEQLNRRVKWHAEEISKSIASQIVKKYTDKELLKLGFESDPEAKKDCLY